MDEILVKASNQAVTFAIRSGISLASGYAIKTVGKLLDRIPASEKTQLEKLKQKLEMKINVLSQSIDLIRLLAARGNSALDSCVDLVLNLKQDIDNFELDINEILTSMSKTNEKDSRRYAELKFNDLISTINDAIPLINLSLITSGVNFSCSLNLHTSPGRFLQASNHVVTSNKEFLKSGNVTTQVGPTFDLKLFSIFYNPSKLKYLEEPHTGDFDHTFITWKEEFARALCYLCRVPKAGYEYDLVIQEDFNDGRYHNTDEENPQDREVARFKRLKLKDIKKQFFSASGKLLKLENSTSPVLTLKIVNDTTTEYLALGEIGMEFDNLDSDSDSERESCSSEVSGYESAAEEVVDKYTHLSLLQYLTRLCSLQESEQNSILNVNDEKLLVYLRDEIDMSIGPQSAEERQKSSRAEESNRHMLTLDSNVNRLHHLSLRDKKEDQN